MNPGPSCLLPPKPCPPLPPPLCLLHRRERASVLPQTPHAGRTGATIGSQHAVSSMAGSFATRLHSQLFGENPKVRPLLLLPAATATWPRACTLCYTPMLKMPTCCCHRLVPAAAIGVSCQCLLLSPADLMVEMSSRMRPPRSRFSSRLGRTMMTCWLRCAAI